MPPQKNSGNKASTKESNASKKSKRFIQNLFEDLRSDDLPTDVYVGRIVKKLGNGRMEVFYSEERTNGELRGHLTQAVIRGSFRGKSKRSVWFEEGSIVIITSTGIAGSAAFEIVALVPQEQYRELRKEMDIDPRVFAMEIVDPQVLMSRKIEDEMGGFIIEHSEETGQPKLLEKEELDDDDIDGI